MKHTLLYFILIWVARFFIGFVVGSFAGIGAEIAALLFSALLFLLLCRSVGQGSVEAHDTTMRSVVFSTLSFAGVLLVCLPLRFLLECALPSLCLRATVYSRFGDIAPLLYFLLYAAGVVLQIFCVICTLRATRQHTPRVRLLLCGGALALFSFSLPCLAADFIFGVFLARFLCRRRSSAIAAVYLAIYRAVLLAFDSLAFRVGATYGSMMGAVQIIGMLLLFAGIAIALALPEACFASDQRPASLAVLACVIGAVLLAIIGCAVIQTSNL